MDAETEADSLFNPGNQPAPQQPVGGNNSAEAEADSLFGSQGSAPPMDAETEAKHLFNDQSAPSPYGSTGQEIGAGLEGAAQGMTFGLSTPVEIGVGKILNAFQPGLGTTSQDIEGREKENPWIHGISEGAGVIGSQFLGYGEGALVAKAGESLATKYLVNSVGKSAAKAAVETALMGAGDQVSKAFIDPDFSVSSAIAHTGLSGLLGAGMGAIFGTAGKILKPVLGDNPAAALNEFVDGAKESIQQRLNGGMATPLAPLESAPAKNLGEKISQTIGNFKNFSPYDKGIHLGNAVWDQGINLVGRAGGALGGAMLGGESTIGEIIAATMGETLGATKSVQQQWLPLIIRGIFNNDMTAGVTSKVLDAGAGMVKAIGGGLSAMDTSIGNVFKVGANKAIDYEMDQGKRDNIDKFVTDTSAEPDRIISMGNIGENFPEHQMALAKTLGQVSQYLQSVKPQTDQTSPFDKISEITPMQKATYNRAIDIANQPLSILNRVKDGSVQTQDVTALKSMYPSMYQNLTTKLEDKLTDHMINGGETIPYTTRIGLSQFLGRPMDSTLAPQSIMRAQMSMQTPTPSQPGQVQGKGKGGGGRRGSMKTLSKISELDATPSQQKKLPES